MNPWEEEWAADFECVVRYSDHDTIAVTQTQLVTSEEMARARFIAAAPDMYRALAEVVEEYEYALHVCDHPPGGSELYETCLEALKKARGET